MKIVTIILSLLILLLSAKPCSDGQNLEVKTWLSNRDFANRLPFGFGGIVEFDRAFSGFTTNYQLNKNFR